ncbi:MAG TPA: hypothetical protein VMZ53_27180 [Kofleriaceae bacterium]|nr:hypothetical protein [Kofleriaceae bacterium]
MARFVLLLLVAFLLGGCIVPHYVQHRAALVPHAAPVQSTGQPMDRVLGFELGATNLADLVAPTTGSVDPPAGIAVAEHQARATFAVAPTPNLHLSFFHEQALKEGSHDISPTLPPLEDDAAFGYGMGFDVSVPTGAPGWRIGIATELTIWNCPYVAYTTETTGGTLLVDSGTDPVGIAAFGLTPSYRQGAWTWFANGTIRNHPTMLEKESSDFVAPDPDVTGGPLNVSVGAGVALRRENVEVALDVHDTLTDDPVRYGPSLGLTFRVFGGKSTHREPAPTTVVVPVH